MYDNISNILFYWSLSKRIRKLANFFKENFYSNFADKKVNYI